MSKPEQALVDALLRTDFETFLHRCILTLNPGAIFLKNWHICAIGYQLGLIERGETTRLIINMPPRHLKSLTVSVAWAAFLLGHNPRRRIIAISYSTELSATHHSHFRAIVESDWYRRIFPHMRISRCTDEEISTTARGFRKSISVFETLTGLGGDLFIIDDPQKPVDAQSDAHRNRLIQWVSSTLMSRLDNKETGAIVVVMQRVHLNDLTGFLKESSNDWRVLSLAAIAETDEQVAIGKEIFHQRQAGEALHPAHESLASLRKQQQIMTPDDFAAQYQQCPVPLGGAMIRREWLRYYDILPERPLRSKVILSWDTAAKDGAQNSWSVCTVWLVINDDYYLLDLIRGRFQFQLLLDTTLQLAKHFKPDVILIEEASTGIALGQVLQASLGHKVKLIPVHRDKIGRLYVQQAKFASGRVHFPRGKAFLRELEVELLTFPQGKNGDQVDSISQALAYKISFWDYSWVY
jgi:predicted phage terminase large subunit-like protein